jgi:excisionase family DNA binding protein
MEVLNMTTTDRYLGTAQAAQMLGLSTERVRQLTDEGRLPCIRLSNGWRVFSEGAVRRFQLERLEKAAARSES